MAVIENVKLFLSSVAESGSVAGKVLADGKVGLSDVQYLPQLFFALKGLSSLNLKEVLPEAKDLSEEEKQELSALFKEKLELPASEASVEEVVEQGLEVLLQAVQAVLGLIEVVRKVKKL